MKQEIQLEHRWTIGEQVGEGGFGKVFAAQGERCASAVVKLIPLAPGASREILIADLATTADVPNIMPVLDNGIVDEYLAIVMPRASMSLRDHLQSWGGPLPLDEAIGILQGVAMALGAIESTVIHRDIKPENVLLLENQWVLSDFGIARIAEMTTEDHTQKYAWSWHYVAPERLQGERATTASDIYSLGIMSYEMLTGICPFTGPDFRSQHLQAPPQLIPDIPAALASLVLECMDKEPAVRPRPANFLRRISGADARPTEAQAKLAEVNRVLAEEAARTRAEAAAAANEAARLRRIAEAGIARFRLLRDRLEQEVNQWASQATGPDHKGRWHLGSAELRLFESIEVPQQDIWKAQGPAFRVVAQSAITILFPADQRGYTGRGHSLWFCDAQEEGEFRWFETSFHQFRKRSGMAPRAMQVNEDSLGSLGSGSLDCICAWPFTPVDQGDEEAFIDRWLGWFADAAVGRLWHPGRIPERDPSGSWRSK